MKIFNVNRDVKQKKGKVNPINFYYGSRRQHDSVKSITINILKIFRKKYLNILYKRNEFRKCPMT